MLKLINQSKQVSFYIFNDFKAVCKLRGEIRFRVAQSGNQFLQHYTVAART